MQVVNGYPCFNCGDVAKAKRNIDPAAPQPNVEPASRQASRAVEPAKDSDGSAGANDPLASGARGTQVNILA